MAAATLWDLDMPAYSGVKLGKKAMFEFRSLESSGCVLASSCKPRASMLSTCQKEAACHVYVLACSAGCEAMAT